MARFLNLASTDRYLPTMNLLPSNIISLSVNDFPELSGRLLVVYDGHCGLCNKSVRWSLRRDTLDHLRFIPSESPRVVALLARHGFPSLDSPSDPDTLLAIRDAGGPSEQVFIRSDAAVVLLSALPRPWPSIATVFRWIPRFLRDLAYRFIARIRYRIWGRFDVCPLPAPAERAHFL